MATQKVEKAEVSSASFATISKIVRKKVKIRIVGDTPLIVHAWSEKAKREMIEKQKKATKTKAKEERKPFVEFVNSMYWLTEKPEADNDEDMMVAYTKAIENGARFGFPVTAFKQAAVDGAYWLGWLPKKTELRSAFFINTEDGGDMAEIKSFDGNMIPEFREDMVRIGAQTKTSDLRYRGEFKNWYVDLVVDYNANAPISLEQILNCINGGGYACGVGEWRPGKDGNFGQYHVEESRT